MDDVSLEFKYTNLIKFGEFVASLRLDYKKRYWPILHKLVKNYSHSPDEPEG